MQNRPDISMMKLWITINVPRLHDIDYRYFLPKAPWISGLPGFDANNLTDGKDQVVDIVIDGKESQFEV